LREHSQVEIRGLGYVPDVTASAAVMTGRHRRCTFRGIGGFNE